MKIFTLHECAEAVLASVVRAGEQREVCWWHHVSGICLEVVRGNEITNFVCLWQLCKLFWESFRWIGFFFTNVHRLQFKLQSTTCCFKSKVCRSVNYNDTTALCTLFFSFTKHNKNVCGHIYGNGIPSLQVGDVFILLGKWKFVKLLKAPPEL